MALQLENMADHVVSNRHGARSRTIVLLAMCLGVLVAQIDTSVVNLASHTIGVTFHSGVTSLQWVLDAYNLVYAVLLLSGGLVADLYGRQANGHLSPSQAALVMMPTAFVFFGVSTQSGRLQQRLGARVMTAGGTAVIGCGLLIIAATEAGRPIFLAQCGLLLTAIGMGLNTGPLHGIAVGSVPPERSGTASALINVARMAGATLGVALLGTVFSLLHGDAAGLRAAMLIGGCVQLGGALIAYNRIR